ncbi:Ldh family oxidoreductase [Roseovarius sp. Pro17]|uniref:Ldh family oxidoreductase n=1 Tax=Roseovarius sp. Pro17 TaxID=3108175 RepID=UPI002D79C590|nr:Ldh family oxidoreductase [Roseovarius sp. Pro17]
MPMIETSEIEALSKAALIRHGAEDWIAASVADAIREAEATGNRICGLYYLESYCQQLKTGRVKGDVVPEVTRPRPGSVRVDAKFGFAQAAFERALPDAIAATKECGTASLAVCHAHTCTSLGYFTGQIARAGLIGLGLTNATPVVAPPGGKSRIIGTNPIAFSVPDGQGGIAMQFDQSTTTTAMGKITMAKAAGESIPEGWAVDADGRPTTDPAAGLAGSMVSLGGSAAGYKGWGFGLMAEILAAGMTGSLASQDLSPLKVPEGAPHDLGQFYLLIDPDMSDHFAARLARVAEGIAADEGARMPGQGRREATSVDVPDALWEQLRGLAGAT